MENNTALKPRLHWIDVLKGVGIILIMMGHINSQTKSVPWIYSVPVALFFALSGFIFSTIEIKKNIPFKEFLVKRLKSLIVPFIFFRLILVVWWLIAERRFRELDMGPIWFLPALFAAEIISYFICKKKNPLLNAVAFILFFAALAGLKYARFDNYAIGKSIMIAINASAWYNFGVLAGCIGKNLKIKKEYAAVAVCALLAITTVCSIYNGTVSLYSSLFGKSILLYITENAFGTVALIMLCKYLLTKSAPLEYLGRYTIILFATHEPIKRVLLKLTEIITTKLGKPLSIDFLQGNFFTSLLILLAVILIELIVIQIFRFIKSKTKSKGAFRILFAFVQE